MIGEPKQFSDKRSKHYQKFMNTLKVSDPSDDLTNIYRRKVLTELAYVRFEKYDSPEHKDKVVPSKDNVNIVNPNFSQLMDFMDRWDGIIKDKKDDMIEQTIKLIDELHKMIIDIGTLEEFEWKHRVYKDKFDVRYCLKMESLEMFYNYLLTEAYLGSMNH